MELAKVYDELYGMIEDLRKQIGSGGGGGGIEINPEGAATADLEKIKKGSDIYGLNYNKNANRPQINGNLLTGNKNSKQLNIAEEMSEAAYAALSSKNENEIYFLTENAPIFTETDTVAASGITWSAGEDPDTYIATLAYSVVDADTTGVAGVTCDNELITIGDPTYSTGTVSVPMICEDPTAITGDIEFIFTLEQPAGGKKIVHNGEEYGSFNYSTSPVKIGKWIDGKDLYRQIISASAIAVDSGSAALVEGVDFFATEFITCTDDSTGSTFSPGVYSTYTISGAGTDYCAVYKDSGNLKILNNNRVNKMSAVACVIYTKTTTP